MRRNSVESKKPEMVKQTRYKGTGRGKKKSNVGRYTRKTKQRRLLLLKKRSEQEQRVPLEKKRKEDEGKRRLPEHTKQEEKIRRLELRESFGRVIVVEHNYAKMKRQSREFKMASTVEQQVNVAKVAETQSNIEPFFLKLPANSSQWQQFIASNIIDNETLKKCTVTYPEESKETQQVPEEPSSSVSNVQKNKNPVSLRNRNAAQIKKKGQKLVHSTSVDSRGKTANVPVNEKLATKFQKMDVKASSKQSSLHSQSATKSKKKNEPVRGKTYIISRKSDKDEGAQHQKGETLTATKTLQKLVKGNQVTYRKPIIPQNLLAEGITLSPSLVIPDQLLSTSALITDKQTTDETLADNNATEQLTKASENLFNQEIDLSYFFTQLHAKFDVHFKNGRCNFADLALVSSHTFNDKNLLFLQCNKCKYQANIWNKS